MWPFSSTKKDEETGIRNFGVVIPGLIYRGAECGEEEFKGLKAMGVRVRLNLIEGDQYADFLEAHRAGLDWRHIKLSDTKPPCDEDIKDALDIMRSGKAVFVGCKGGRHRTGIVCAVFRVVDCAWSREEAWEECEKYDWYDRRWPAPSHKALRLWFFEKFKPEKFR